MNARPLTDAQIASALRAHLPEAAAPGLRERVFDAAATTPQLRSFPSFLGALSDADPVGRRRSLLMAAALLVALAVASAVAVGAWRLLQRDPIDELSLEPPADVPAFVLSSYERLPHLPPLALTWHDSDSAKGRIYVDRSGAVRFDRFTSAEAAEPTSYRILSPDHRISGMAPVESAPVWVEQGDEAIGEDPRVFLRTVLSADEGPGCEMERDPSNVGNDTVAAGWRYVGLEEVAGRPTHHVACAGDLWIDIETRLILRTQGPAVDDAGQAIPVEFTEVTEIAFGEQPAALFEPPEGVTRMSAAEYSAYNCARDLPNEMAPGISDCPSTEEPEATRLPEPSPSPTVRPNTSPCAFRPGDPGEPIGSLAWTTESLKGDWPAPVRLEPAGGGSVKPMPLTYVDPTGDNGSTALPCVDIRWVTADTSEVQLKLDSSQPVADPTEQWIAYGVVTDDDLDGVPDWRYGIDNMPAAAGEDRPRMRGWRTNLHTGETEAGPYRGDPPWALLGGGFQAAPPTDSADWDPFATFRFGGAVQTTQGSHEWGFELDMPFYTWASVIVNGRVVATDYAPDAGWLVATRGVRPGGTFLLEGPLLDLSMSVPEGWTTRSANELSRVTCGGLGRHVGPDEAYRADCARVAFDVIGDPLEWLDPCENTIEPPVGSRFDAFVSCVASRGREGNGYGAAIITSEIVTVDGYRGKHFEYSPETRSVGCPYDCGDVWILDVDGVLLMIGSLPTGDLDGDVAEEAVQAEIRQMVESIHFER